MARHVDHGCQPARQVRAGFTLLEVLIALMILVIGLSAIFLVFSTAVGAHRRGVDQAQAALLTQSVLAEWKEKLLSTDAPAAPLLLKDQSQPGFPARYSYDIEMERLGSSDEQVHVRIAIHWKAKGERGEEVLDTVLLRRPNR